MSATALGIFAVTSDEWREMLCIFSIHRAFCFIEMWRRNLNRPIEHKDLTEELVGEINQKLDKVGMLVRVKPNGTRGRFEYPRFVRI